MPAFVGDGAAYRVRRTQGGVDVLRDLAGLHLHIVGIVEVLLVVIPLWRVCGRGLEAHFVCARGKAVHLVGAASIGLGLAYAVMGQVPDLDADAFHAARLGRAGHGAADRARRLQGGVDVLRDLAGLHLHLVGFPEVRLVFIPLGEVSERGLEEHFVCAFRQAAHLVGAVFFRQRAAHRILILVKGLDPDVLHPIGLDRAGHLAFNPARRLQGGVDVLRGLAQHHLHLVGIVEVRLVFIPLGQVFLWGGVEAHLVCARGKAAHLVGAVFSRQRAAHRVLILVEGLDPDARHALILRIGDGAAYPARRLQGGVDVLRGLAQHHLHLVGIVEVRLVVIPLGQVFLRGQEAHFIFARGKAAHHIGLGEGMGRNLTD